jgi:hypothetical protein
MHSPRGAHFSAPSAGLPHSGCASSCAGRDDGHPVDRCPYAVDVAGRVAVAWKGLVGDGSWMARWRCPTVEAVELDGVLHPALPRPLDEAFVFVMARTKRAVWREFCRVLRGETRTPCPAQTTADRAVAAVRQHIWWRSAMWARVLRGDAGPELVKKIARASVRRAKKWRKGRPADI